MSFFDTTPLGRITSRLSSDTDNVDVQLPQNFRLYAFLVAIISTVVVIMSFSGIFSMIGVIVLLVSFWIFQVAVGFFNSNYNSNISGVGGIYFRETEGWARMAFLQREFVETLENF